MRAVNPWLIPRNHRVEEALEAATQGDGGPFERLLQALQQPHGSDPGLCSYAAAAPRSVTENYRTFCGT